MDCYTRFANLFVFIVCWAGPDVVKNRCSGWPTNFVLQCFDSVVWAINPVKLFARRVMWHYTLPYHMMVHLPSACVPGLRFDVSPRLYTACSYTQLIGDTIYSGHTHPSWHESYPLPTGPSVCNHVLPLLAVCPQSKFWYIVMMYVICSTVKLTI